jgi:hypothetical protein
MKGHQRKIDEYVSVKPSRFGLLTRFEWFLIPLVEGYSQHLAINLSRGGSGTDELILNFKEVRGLQFSCHGLATVLLEVRDISDQQWEQAAFEVKDIENAAISFLCSDFSFKVSAVTG